MKSQKDRTIYALTTAIENDDIDLIKSFIEHGADVNSKGLYHYDYDNGIRGKYRKVIEIPILFYAIIASNNPESIELLLEAGADINAQTELGHNALDMLKYRETYSAEIEALVRSRYE